MFPLKKLFILFFLIYQLKASPTCSWNTPFLDYETDTCIAETDCSFKLDSICYNYCPNSKPYHKKGEKDCTDLPTGNYLMYEYEYVTDGTCDSTWGFQSTFSTSNNLCYKCDQNGNKFWDSVQGKCLSSCPIERPYYDSYNECKTECYGIEKYHKDGSKQCELKIPDNYYYEFNYVLYTTTCPSGTTPDSKKCKCQNKFYTTYIGGDKTKITCLDNSESCPSEKKYLKENECLAERPDTNCDYLKKVSDYYVCATECDDTANEFKYGDSAPIYCLTECPKDKPYKEMINNDILTIYIL